MSAYEQLALWYCVTESFSFQDVRTLGTVLSHDEHERGSRFAFQEDRRDFILAHSLLRHALSRHAMVAPAEWRFDRSSTGKPSITRGHADAPPLAFSLSHTQGFVACAVMNGDGADIGIDVERCGRVADAAAIADRHFTGAECAWLNTPGEGLFSSRFVELWTLKEAYLKATGTGLSAPLDSIAFTFGGPADLQYRSGDSNSWHFRLAALEPDLRIALAVRFHTPLRHLHLSFVEWASRSGCRPVLLRSSECGRE